MRNGFVGYSGYFGRNPTANGKFSCLVYVILNLSMVNLMSFFLTLSFKFHLFSSFHSSNFLSVYFTSWRILLLLSLPHRSQSPRSTSKRDPPNKFNAGFVLKLMVIFLSSLMFFFRFLVRARLDHSFCLTRNGQVNFKFILLEFELE